MFTSDLFSWYLQNHFFTKVCWPKNEQFLELIYTKEFIFVEINFSQFVQVRKCTMKERQLQPVGQYLYCGYISSYCFFISWLHWIISVALNSGKTCQFAKWISVKFTIHNTQAVSIAMIRTQVCGQLLEVHRKPDFQVADEVNEYWVRCCSLMDHAPRLVNIL